MEVFFHQTRTAHSKPEIDGQRQVTRGTGTTPRHLPDGVASCHRAEQKKTPASTDRGLPRVSTSGDSGGRPDGWRAPLESVDVAPLQRGDGKLMERAEQLARPKRGDHRRSMAGQGRETRAMPSEGDRAAARRKGGNWHNAEARWSWGGGSRSRCRSDARMPPRGSASGRKVNVNRGNIHTMKIASRSEIRHSGTGTHRAVADRHHTTEEGCHSAMPC